LSGTSGPDPGFPNHNIAASFVNRKVCVTWQHAWGEPQESIYYRVSTDGGTTWGEAQVLPMPPAYGPDTLPSLTITSPFPYYDRHDRLHFVVNVCPIVRDTTWILPTEIWHWCEENVPQWNEVHRAGCEPQNLWASPGYNTTYAGRPSIGEDTAGNLFVAWEQFDSANVEPSTNLLRADIFLSYSRDNGLSWAPALQLTEAVTESNRFPCVIDYVTDGMVRVWYMADLQAGFIVQGQGILTDNPIVVRSIPVDSLRGLAENRESVPNGAPQAASICRGVLFLPGGAGHLPRDMTEFGTANSGRVPRPELVDVSGRTVMPLKPGPNDVRHLPASVYFVHSSLDTRHSSLSTKVVIQR
jgi:hypothetical protein